MTITGAARFKALIDQEGTPFSVSYDLLQKEIVVEGELIDVYGIGIRTAGGEHERVEDISSDKQAVISLLELFWEMDVTPATLKDIIQDYIEN